MATGRTGTGGLLVPGFVDPALWPDRAAHSAEPDRLRAPRRAAHRGAGRRRLGLGQRLDGARAGAARVDIYARRRTLPQIGKGRGSSNPGFSSRAGARWQRRRGGGSSFYSTTRKSPPPHEERAPGPARSGLRPASRPAGAPVVADGEGVALTLGPDGDAAKADFLIRHEGFVISSYFEFEELRAHAATWADRHVPPEAMRRPELGKYPWLGPAFEMTEKEPGSCPAAGRVHLFNQAAMASLGAIASDIPGVNVGAERLASRIAQAFLARTSPICAPSSRPLPSPSLRARPSSLSKHHAMQRIEAGQAAAAVAHIAAQQEAGEMECPAAARSSSPRPLC